jgi:hypothetical protein
MNLEMFRNTPPQESLAEPRFVDEATLLSARPVIPIAALEAKSRLRQHLTLFLAVITSMLFGAGAAAFIVHLEHGAEGRTTQVESSPAEPQRLLGEILPQLSRVSLAQLATPKGLELEGSKLGSAIPETVSQQPTRWQ